VVTRVPFVDLAVQEASVASDVLAAIGQVASEARFVLGARVEAFEQWMSQACEVTHAVGVASGSDALELGLRALGIGPEDAVITPAFSFVAAAEAIASAGARPVFCDVDPETMNVNERTVQDALDRARRAGMRVRAILPVHLFGRCAPVGGLRALAAREGLAVLEDAAQAMGSRDESGRAGGSGGDAACFSFFPTKNLGAWGDGGAFVTDRPDLAQRVRRLRAHGAVEPYVHAELGRNSRLDAVQAAVLLAKSKHLPEWQRARERIAQRYLSAFARLPMTLPAVPALPGLHAWHAFVVRSDRRDALASTLREGGVEARVYYPVPLHRQPCFESLQEPSLPTAEEICRTALALPVFPVMRDDQQELVIDRVRRFFRAGVD
jgi:dTDP-4-amino-4,6-dideoxygalactose transaminase